MLADATALPRVTGHCPSCGRSTLVLSPTGEVICAHLGCERPSIVTLLLTDPNAHLHLLELGTETFSISHPIAERLDAAMHECSLHTWLRSLAGPPTTPGRYRAEMATGPNGAPVWTLERFDDAPAT
jgi:hypothetical protein